MKWELDKKRPLMPQICEQLCVRIACNLIKPGERLLSVRNLAMEIGVNPNTVQRCFEMLDEQGILRSVRGSGWFVSEDISSCKTVLDGLIREKTADYFAAMQALGLRPDEIKEYVKEWNHE